jgi:hypothetical protein
MIVFSTYQDAFTIMYKALDWELSGISLLEVELYSTVVFRSPNSCKNRRFGGTQLFHHQDDKNRYTRNNVSRVLSP